MSFRPGALMKRDARSVLEIATGAPALRARPRELELSEQIALFRWAELRAAHHPGLEMLYAVPNGGARSKAQAGKMKASGAKKGVPDVVLPVARARYHGLYIELKAKDAERSHQKPTEAQLGWLAALTAQGYHAVCCIGWENASETILAYLKQEKIG